MSLLRLLTVLFAFSLSFAFAEDQPSQNERAPAGVTTPDSANPVTSVQTPTVYRFSLNAPSKRALSINPDLNATCYTMRTYRVQRDDRRSDSVHPVGYTTCQPAPRFDLKVTTQPVETNSGQK